MLVRVSGWFTSTQPTVRVWLPGKREVVIGRLALAVPTRVVVTRVASAVAVSSARVILPSTFGSLIVTVASPSRFNEPLAADTSTNPRRMLKFRFETWTSAEAVKPAELM